MRWLSGYQIRAAEQASPATDIASNAVIKLYVGGPPKAAASTTSQDISVGAFVIRPTERQVLVDGTNVVLTNRELSMLLQLSHVPERTVPRAEPLAHAEPEDALLCHSCRRLLTDEAREIDRVQAKLLRDELELRGLTRR
jgi:DNA-binding response OmpR family regulator